MDSSDTVCSVFCSRRTAVGHIGGFGAHTGNTGLNGGSTRAAGEWTLSRTLVLGMICVFWAGSSVAAKIALGDGGAAGQGKIGPFTLASLRFGAAGLLLVLLLRTRHELVPIARDDLLRFVLLGALGIAITYAVMYGGLLYTTATETTLLFGAEPVLIALLARLVLGEHLRSAQSVGMMLGLIGVYLVVFRGLAPRFEGTIVANAIVSGSMLFEAYASVLGKRLTGRYPGLMVAAIEMLVGSVLLVPFAVRELATR